MKTARQPAQSRGLPFWTLLTANLISMTGNVMALVVIPWFVLQTTGSATQTGITGFFNILPVVLAGLLSGVFVDRLGYKRASIIADIASAVTVALIPLLHFTIGLEFWQLLVLVFLGALLDTPGNTARSALVPELAEMAGIDLERAASYSQIVERSSRLIGAPLAGLLIGVMGSANVLWINAGSFVVSALLVAVLVPVVALEEKEEGSTYWTEIVEGWQFIRGDRLVMTLGLVLMGTNGLDMAFGAVVLPVYVNEVFGEALNLGLLVAANGGGAVVGALLYSAYGARFSRRWVFILMFAITGLRFWSFAIFPSIAVLLSIMFLSSVGAGPLNPILSAIWYERIPKTMRGRVFGTLTAIAWLAMPIGTLLGGFLTEQLGLVPMLMGLGALYLLLTLSMALMPVTREIERRPAGVNASE